MCSRRPHNELHRQSAGPGALFPGKQLAQLRYSQIARRIFGIDYYRHVSRLSKSSVTEAHACPTENQGGDPFPLHISHRLRKRTPTAVANVKVLAGPSGGMDQVAF